MDKKRPGRKPSPRPITTASFVLFDEQIVDIERQARYRRVSRSAIVRDALALFFLIGNSGFIPTSVEPIEEGKAA